MKAAQQGHESVVEVLLDYDADVNLKILKPINTWIGAIKGTIYSPGWTAIVFAAKNGFGNVVKYLIQAKAAINRAKYFYDDCDTPLSYAARSGYVQVVRLLLEHGAEMNDKYHSCHSGDCYDYNHGTPLSYAARKGHEEVVGLLLGHGAEANAKTHSFDDSALVSAAKSGHDNIVGILLERGANVNAEGNKSETALMCATKRGHENIVRMLISYGAKLYGTKATSDTPLVYAIKNGHQNIANMLINSFSARRIDRGCARGYTPLMSAAEQGSEYFVRLLIESGASVNRKTRCDVPYGYKPVAWLPFNSHTWHHYGYSALMFAAANGHATCVSLLCQSGASIDLVTHHGFTAMMLAAANGHIECVRLLVARRANLDKRSSYGYTTLMFAAGNGHDEIVHLMLQGGAVVDRKTARKPRNRAFNRNKPSNLDFSKNGLILCNRYRYTALMFAAENGHGKCVELLVRGGAATSHVALDGHTALMRAAGNGHIKCVRLLLESYGHYIDQKTVRGDTALIFAAENGFKNCVCLLLDSGVSIDDKSERGHTALIRSAENGHEKCVRLLCEREANADMRAYKGVTTLMQAARNDHDKCFRLLLLYGASVDLTAPSRLFISNFFDDEALPMDIQKIYLTTLLIVTEKGYDKYFSMLLKAGAKVDYQDPKYGYTALMLAVSYVHERCIRLLLEGGACIDKQANDGRTALMIAAEQGYEDIVKFLLEHGAAVDMVDENKNSAVMLTASKNRTEVVSLLLQASAFVDLTSADGRSAVFQVILQENIVERLIKNKVSMTFIDDDGRTPLMIAAMEGNDAVVRLLLDSGVSVGTQDHDQSTAIMLAISKGHHKVVRIIREHGPSTNIRNIDNMNVFMLAADFGDFVIMRELLQDPELVDVARVYLNDGMPQYTCQTGGKQLKVLGTDSLSATSTAQVYELCPHMPDTEIIFSKLHSRLADLKSQVKMLPKIVQRAPLKRLMNISKSAQSCLDKYAGMPTIIHLASSRQIVNACRNIHKDMDEFMAVHGFPSKSDVHVEWKAIFEEDARKYLSAALRSIQTNHQLLFDEVKTSNKALMLLRFECEDRASFHRRDEMNLLKLILDQASKFSTPSSSTVPKWFISPQDIEIKSEIAKGGYGSVHHARWLGAKVVAKTPLLLDTESREMFLREVDNWHRLEHLNIVKLYGACHLDKPMLVCEYAENGTLSNFLYRENGQAKTWEKLYEAAVGLQYMHEVHKTVHGDLKCDNILVGGTRSSKNGPAKLTDFGLSYKGVDPNTEEIAAIQWKAPEAIECRTRGPFASDVYSLGMCILEAVKGACPWGDFPDVTVRYKLLRLKQLPSRPKNVNDAQ